MTAFMEIGAADQVMFDVDEKGRVKLVVPGQRLYPHTPATSVKKNSFKCPHRVAARHLGIFPYSTISFLLPLARSEQHVRTTPLRSLPLKPSVCS